jgi:hypothetical protein
MIWKDALRNSHHGTGAHVAQSAEHILGKDEVTGSIPVMGFEKVADTTNF